MIERVINIKPTPASRPRVTARGTFYHKAYTEFKRDFPKLLGRRELLSGALEMQIQFIMPMAQSWTKKKTLEMDGKFHTQVPDADNLAKAVIDSCNGYFYKDDSQIAVLVITKIWGKFGQISFKIKEIA